MLELPLQLVPPKGPNCRGVLRRKRAGSDLVCFIRTKTLGMHLPELFHSDKPARSFTRMTNFKPDQISLIAQTFTSTSPASRPICRTELSDKSVTTPEAFFGQAIHNIPVGASFDASRVKFWVSSNCDFTKNKITSSDVCTLVTNLTSSGRPMSSRRKPGGAPTSATRYFAFIPNFFDKGAVE